MIPLQRIAHLSQTTDLYTSRSTRRAFFKRALELGLCGNAAIALLAACNSSKPNATVNTIAWESEGDLYSTFNYLANKFSLLNPSIQVTQILAPSGRTDPNNAASSSIMHDTLASQLQEKSESPDVLALDVVWVSEFANNGWIVPLDDIWTKEERAKYLHVPLEAVNFNGKVWAAPLHTDVGVLYYRTDMPDIIPTPPQTWQELAFMARHAMTSGKTRWGYVWQGDQYEGLLCNFVEVLSGYEGRIFDAHNPKEVVINSSAAQQALAEMINWVGTISPPEILTYQETDAGNKWLAGDAAFMRNWPNYISLSNDGHRSKVAGNFGVASLPSPAQSCLGGWQLAINRFSKNQDAAWAFIQWMLQEDAQQYLAIKEGFAVTLQSIYANGYVRQVDPFFATLQPILENAQFRPVSPHYQHIADTIERYVHQALSRKISVPNALQAMQVDLEHAIS